MKNAWVQLKHGTPHPSFDLQSGKDRLLCNQCKILGFCIICSRIKYTCLIIPFFSKAADAPTFGFAATSLQAFWKSTPFLGGAGRRADKDATAAAALAAAASCT
jgi:hypothetical protein